MARLSGRLARTKRRPPPVTVLPPTPPGLLWGFDSDGGNNPAALTAAWFAARFAEGYRVYGTTGHSNWGGNEKPWTGCQALFANAIAGGIPYIYLYGRSVEHIGEAIDAAGQYAARIAFVELDVEDPGHPLARWMANLALARLIQAGNPTPRVIVYSGRGMWGNAGMDVNDASFADLPLHEYAGEATSWPTHAPLDEAPRLAFGGWNENAATTRHAVQLRMMVPVMRGGVAIDESAFLASLVEG